MVDKIIRFIKALRDESIKRLPYIVLVFVVLIFGQGYLNSRQTKENSVDTKTLLHKVADLSQDNQKLQQQGIALQKKSNDQITCLTDLFVDYVNSGRQLTRADVKNCSVSPETAVQSEQPSQPTASQQLSPTSNLASGGASSAHSKPAAKAPPAQSNNSPKNSSGLFDRFVYTPVTNFLKQALGVQ